MTKFDPMRFNFQPMLTGQTIATRALRNSDFDEFYACASDKKIWEGHPSKNRYQYDEFVIYFKDAMDSQACLVITDLNSNKIIGSSRYYRVDKTPDDIAIGFTFLARDYWGGKTNYELKQLMIAHALKSFPAVWFHVALCNIRSQKATLKTGAKFVGEDTLEIGGTVGQWLCYRVDKNI